MASEVPSIRIIGFKTTYDLVPKRGHALNDTVDDQGFLLDAKGRRVMEREPIDWITYAPAHSPLNTRTTERVKHITPNLETMGNDPDGRRYAFMQARWAQIEPAYTAWKAGRETPLNGTPLAVWAGISPEQIEVFRQFSIQTVEEVANLSESQMERIRLPNMRELKAQSRIFLDNMGASQAAEMTAKMQETMEAMQARMMEMEEALHRSNAALADKEAASAEVDDEIAALRVELDARGIAYDKRSGVQKLRAALHAPVTQAA